jgi:hypothetical protein
MSLTPDGNLGVGKTNPTETFEVVGTSTVTSDSFIGGDFSVSGSITGGSLSISGSSSLKSTTIIGSVGIFANSPNYTLQIGDDLSVLGIGTGVGISSSGDIVATGIVTASKFVGIGSDITLLTPENISSGTITNVNINSSSGVVTTGTLSATYLSGIGSNITSITPENISSGTITNVNINSSSGIITTDTLNATNISGNGDGITSIPAESISSGTITNVNINSSSGVVTTGILTATTIYGEGSNITSIVPENIIPGEFPAGTYNFPVGSYVGINTDNNSGGSLRVDNVAIIGGIGTFNSESGITTFIDELSNSFFKVSEYFIHFEYPGYIQVENIVLTHNSVGSMYTTYGSINNPGKIVTISSSIFDESTRLEVTPETGINGLTTYRYYRKIIVS